MGRHSATNQILKNSVFLVFLGLSARAFAYTPTVTNTGTPVRWHGTVRLPLAGNPTNRNGIDPASFFSAVTRGLQRWQSASNGGVTFDYWQGTDPEDFPTNSAFDRITTVHFASAQREWSGVSSNVLGLTQVWYDTDSGEILEADVVLNDIGYTFTTNPHDTTGTGNSDGTVGNGRQVYIENVLTHELGHAYGLSHSGGLQSTMLFREYPEQALLGCDEQVGIHALYGGSGASERGGLRGHVNLSTTGSPVFGAQVLAISQSRGVVLASAMTDKSGYYEFVGLEPGDYFLMVEPFYATASVLPSYYAASSFKLCDGRDFGRTFLSQAGNPNLPQGVRVTSGAIAQAPALVARCGTMGAAIPAFEAAETRASAPVVYDGASGGQGFGVDDQIVMSRPSYYKLHNVSGDLDIHAMAYSLYSPLKAQLELLDSQGNPLTTQVEDPVYSGSSGYVNFDSAIHVSGLMRGDYLIRVSGGQLDSSLYPAGSVSLDSVPFVLVTGTISSNRAIGLTRLLPDNARCRMNEEFATYVSPPGRPYRRPSTDETKGGGFCGTIDPSHRPPGGGGPGPGAITGWFLPFGLMGLIARLSRRGVARLRPAG